MKKVTVTLILNYDDDDEYVDPRDVDTRADDFMSTINDRVCNYYNLPCTVLLVAWVPNKENA
jgi:hypothetical protein